MNVPNAPLSLVSWRRAVAELYAAVRAASPEQREAAWHTFREKRDLLMRHHPQSPLPVTARATFSALPYYEYDQAARVVGEALAEPRPVRREMKLPEGLLHLERVGRVRFSYRGERATLALWWVVGYGGGLFLPFRDATNGTTTYGGGRYLYDTIKGADLGAGPLEIVLDFNYAYHPSCAYDDRWVCPLAPEENVLDFAVEAGERQAQAETS